VELSRYMTDEMSLSAGITRTMLGMSLRKRPMLIGLVLLATVAACGGTSTSPSAVPSIPSEPTGLATQTSEGGQVTVVATWAGPTAGAAIDVALDTHSVDLDALDLANATLRNDRGETLTARPWAAPKGGHHREGPLTFAGNAATFFAGVTWIELVVVGIGDLPERTLRWEVGS
jgi:hypothetical protein